MKTFTFTHIDLGYIFSVLATNFEEAEFILNETIQDVYGWRINNEKGEDPNDIII